MAYTTDDLSIIERAIASGQLRIRLSDGSEIQYQNTSDLMRVRALIESGLANVSTAPTVRRIRIFTNKDF